MLLGCLPPLIVALPRTSSEQLTPDEKIDYALDRLTFGPRPGDHAFVKRVGLKLWLRQQLHPDSLADNPGLEKQLANLDTLQITSADLFSRYGSRPSKAATDDNATSRPSATTLRNVLTQEQFAAWKDTDPQAKCAALSSLSSDQNGRLVTTLGVGQKRALLPYAPVDLRRNLLRTFNPNALVADDLSEAKLLRAVYSTHQLGEVLADFWFNHFNVFLEKGADRYLVTDYNERVVRPLALGKFYDLLLATAQSPAMLFYLDNWQSAAPNSSPHKTGHERGLNENYARELLELHTLGVNGGYSQKDVTEIARCFTGWTIDHPRQGGTFRYNDRWHDKGAKVVLGHTISPGGGMNDGLQVLAILAHHPATAHFIAFNLAQRFVRDDPPPSLVIRMAQEFTRTDGDMRKVMESMFSSKEFWARSNRKMKLKTPFDLLVSAVRASDANVYSAWYTVSVSQQLGEPLFRKREPNGYSNRNDDWMSAASLVGRINFVSALVQNQIPGLMISQSNDRQALTTLLTGADFERR